MEFLNKALKEQGGSAAVMKSVAALIESQGGVSGLVSKFNSAGLGDKVQSWIGKGPNQSLSSDEVRQAVGDEELEKVAQDAGVSKDEAAGHIASALPAALDQLTPDGQIPSLDQLKSALGSFKF